jgi:hypothetical protein
MKKIGILFFASVIMLSCATDVKFNNPGFVALKENFSWQSTFTTATVANGELILTGNKDLETVTLKVPAPTSAIVSTAPKVYTFGVLDQPSAQYSSNENGVLLEYKTARNLGDGELVINEYNPSTKQISGTFRFNAKFTGADATIPKNINFQRGNYYKIEVK